MSAKADLNTACKILDDEAENKGPATDVIHLLQGNLEGSFLTQIIKDNVKDLRIFIFLKKVICSQNKREKVTDKGYEIYESEENK